jgi:hypothetical protein
MDEHKRLKELVPIREYIQKILPPRDEIIGPLFKHFQELLEFATTFVGESSASQAIARVSSNYSNIQNFLRNRLQHGYPDLRNSIYCICHLNSCSQIVGHAKLPLMDQIRDFLPRPCDHQFEAYFITELFNSRKFLVIPNPELLKTEALEHFEHFEDQDLKCGFPENLVNFFTSYRFQTNFTMPSVIII